jgi:hypothetical protein
MDNFGFKMVSKKTIKGPYPTALWGSVTPVKLTYAKLKLNNSSILLELIQFHTPNLELKFTQAHIAFTVKNIFDLYYKLSSKNINFLCYPLFAPDSKCIVCFCKDLDQNLIELVEE